MCPCCGVRATSVVLEVGPVLVRHQREWTENGDRRRCRQQWVAVPDPVAASVSLIPVEGRMEADEVLRSEAARWLTGQRQAVSDVFGVQLP